MGKSRKPHLGTGSQGSGNLADCLVAIDSRVNNHEPDSRLPAYSAGAMVEGSSHGHGIRRGVDSVLSDSKIGYPPDRERLPTVQLQCDCIALAAGKITESRASLRAEAEADSPSPYLCPPVKSKIESQGRCQRRFKARSSQPAARQPDSVDIAARRREEKNKKKKRKWQGRRGGVLRRIPRAIRYFDRYVCQEGGFRLGWLA